MTDMFECAATTVMEGRVAVWKDEKVVHIRVFGVSWTLAPEVALSLAHDIRCELDDEVAMYEPWTMKYCYWVEADEHTVSMRRDSEKTSLVLDNMDAEMLADWLEGSRWRPSTSPSERWQGAFSAPSWQTSWRT